MFTSVKSRAAAAYRLIAVETSVQGADPHHLVSLLYDGLVRTLQQARGAMERGEIEAKGVALGKAARILEEGLKAGLNMREGGDLALNLRRLYDYSMQRITLANARNDAALVSEVLTLIEPLAQSWQAMRSSAHLQSATGRGA